jgi:uncharacterized SAM-binding protein YcdF (DUF218 family)
MRWWRLQDEARTAAKAAPACCHDAIVVLGGGIGPATPPVPEPFTDSAERIWHAARLYRRGLAPRIIASGGGAADMSEAEAMRLFLTDLGVPAQAIVLEANSLNTIENIRHVRTQVKDGRVALVTSATHMPRALRLARTAGLNVAAFPTDGALRRGSRLRRTTRRWAPFRLTIALKDPGQRLIAAGEPHAMTRTVTGAAWRLDRRAALGMALAGPLLVPLARRPRAQSLDKVSFQTDWRAQAEHGGYYQAIAAGLYARAGIECDLRQGGPSLNIGQLLLTGRVDMIMSNSFEAFTYVREGAPFYTIAAIFQKDPQVLIGHPGSGLEASTSSRAARY